MEKIQTGQTFSTIVENLNEAMEYTVPVGTILPYVGTTTPDGWLMCNGQYYTWDTKYAKLARLLNGSNAQSGFTVPDLQGKYLKGISSWDTNTNKFIESDGTFHVLNTPSTYTGTARGSTNEFFVYSKVSGQADVPNVGIRFIIKY